MSKRGCNTTSDPMKFSEYQRFLKELHRDGKYNWEIYAVVSFTTACRSSDVLKLKWKDILDKSTLTVTEQKTKKTRTISFNPSVQQKFKELYDLMGRPDKEFYVAKSAYGENRPMTVQHINKVLKALKEKYNIDCEHFSTHSFRKTFGRYVYDTCGHTEESLLLLSRIFKHQSSQVTKAYIGITQQEIANIFDYIKL
jgi:integrase